MDQARAVENRDVCSRIDDQFAFAGIDCGTAIDGFEAHATASLWNRFPEYESMVGEVEQVIKVAEECLAKDAVDSRTQPGSALKRREQELLVECSSRSEGNFPDESSAYDRGSGNRSQLDAVSREKAEPAGDRCIDLIALLTRIKDEAVRTVPVKENAVDDGHAVGYIKPDRSFHRLQRAGFAGDDGRDYHK